MLSLRSKQKTKTETTKNPIAETFPIKDVGPDYFQRKDGKYCATAAITPINMDLLPKKSVRKVVDALQEAINLAPDRIQISISSERLNLDTYLEELAGHARKAKADYQLELLESMQNEIRHKSQGNEKVLQFYITVQSQFTKEAPALAELIQILQQTQNSLKKHGIEMERLGRRQLMAFWYQKLNQSRSLREPFHSDFELKHIYPTLIDTKTYSNAGYYIVDEHFYKSFTIEGFPTTQEKASWLTEVFQLPINLDVTFTIEGTDKQAFIQETNRSLRDIHAAKLESQRDAWRMRQLTSKEKDGTYILDLLDQQNEGMFNVTIVITIWEHSIEQLKNSEQSLGSKLNGKRLVSRPLLRYAFQPLWYTLPICYKGMLEKKVFYPMPARTIASIQPFNSSVITASDGIVLGMNLMNHDLVIFGNKERKRFPHTVLLGDTGAGKSFTLNGIIKRRLAQRETVIDIDPERERGYIPGNHVLFGLNHKFRANVFHIRSTIDDRIDNERETGELPVGAYLRYKMDQNMSFFRWIYPQMTSVDKAAILQAQASAYAKHGLTFESTKLPDDPEAFPTMSDFTEALKERGSKVEDLIDSLYPYHGQGLYANIFDGPTNFDFYGTETTPGGTRQSIPHLYTRLDIHEFPEDVRPMLMDLLIRDIWEFGKKDREHVMNVDCDEAWIMADPKQPLTLKFLVEMHKRGRKYGIHMITATQNVADFLRTAEGESEPIGQGILSLAKVKILMAMDGNDIEKLSKFVKLSEQEVETLGNTTKQGEGIIILGNQHAQFQSFMTEAEMRLYNPKRYEELYGREGMYA